MIAYYHHLGTSLILRNYHRHHLHDDHPLLLILSSDVSFKGTVSRNFSKFKQWEPPPI